MKRVLLLVAILAVGCGKGPSEGQCKKLMDHLIGLEFTKANASATAESQKADLAKQKAAVLENKSPEFMSACIDKTSRSRVECSIKATDLEAVAKCDESN